MHNRYSTLLLLLAALAVASLTACDQSEQNIDFGPGSSLTINGPSAAFAPGGSATFQVRAFTINKDYDWSVDGPGEVSTNVRQEGEYLDATFDEPGTYTVSVTGTGEGDEYTGSTTIVVSYPDVVTQAGRQGFGTLGTALGAAGLTDALASGGPFTVFAPTDEAFAALLDDEDDGVDMGDLPAESVLSDILQYHVVPDSLPASQLSGPAATLEGAELTFEGSGENVTVLDGTDLTDPAAVTNANVPASNGLIHAIDALRLPPTASVAFDDQPSADSVTVTVRSVYVPRNGYVAIHDSTLLDDPPQVAGSVIGVSEYREAGLYNNLEVELFDVPGAGFPADTTLQGDQLLIAMPHEETNMNEEYNFITSDGDEDGAYTEDGSAVVDPGFVTVGEN